ncbi:MAG: site-2 protease family protein [Candidatus Sumerlaeia bacterium]
MLDFLQQNPYILLLIPIFLFSLSLHEFAHAYAATRAGDTLAAYKGRLTLNPLAHVDLFGTIIIPALMLFGTQGGAFFGWAKPVPVNPLRYRKPWWEIVVSGAGPASNVLLVIVFWIVLVICLALDLFRFDQRGVMGTLIFWFIHLNVLLAFFNLLPFPPLDGSHILIYFIYRRPGGEKIVDFLMKYGFVLFIVFLLTPLSDYFFMFTAAVTGFLLNSAEKLVY